MKLGEFELIDWIKSRFEVPQGITGIGDDCAIVPEHEGFATLVSTDMLIDGVHFLMDDADPFSLGWKSAAVNVSDIAAMGGQPVGSFLSIALPRTLPDDFVKSFMEGYKALSDKYDCPLLGGDTTSSLDRLCISVTVMGRCPVGASVKRNGALPGDLICVTGPLGDSAAGLRCILDGCSRGPVENALIYKHYHPLPRVSEGLSLASSGVHSMMDISDGVASDLRHILRASGKAPDLRGVTYPSGVGARVDCTRLPISDDLQAACSAHGWDPVALALEGGEDYELLFAISPADEARLTVEHSVIGEIIPGEGIEWIGASGDFHGFRHF